MQISHRPIVAALLKKIHDREAVVGVIGLGYVGLPLISTFHDAGYPVLGFDIDTTKINRFENGVSYIKHISTDVMQVMAKSNRCAVTSDFTKIAETDIVLICVPTPLNRFREPDLSFIEKTVQSIGPYLKRGQMVVLESTTYPGTTEEVVLPMCEELSGLKSGKDFFVAYSPEREDPGNSTFKTSTIPKVVGAEGEDAMIIVDQLYSSVITATVPVSNSRTAEAVKLLENIFRSVNIALVNELKVVFHEMDIDVFEVINAAATKPFGFMPFYPGPGIGGHCIPIDPFYLTWKAREFGLNTRFIELAGEINASMPHYVLRRCIEALNKAGKALSSSRVLCIGLAYKPDVDDVRESPTFTLMDLFKAYSADVDYYDPHIQTIPETREHTEWTGKQSISWGKSAVSEYDLVVILTKHSDVDHEKLREWASLIVDTRNALPESKGDSKKYLFRA